MSSEESILTFQGEETGFANDESDTPWSSSEEEDEEEEELSAKYVAGKVSEGAGTRLLPTPPIEYDPPELSEDDGDPLGETDNSSGMEVMKVYPGVMAAIATMQDSSIDSSPVVSDDSNERPDPELSKTDYWKCCVNKKCKEKRNNPLFRFCERCYRERKGFLPSRPFPIKTRNDLLNERKERRERIRKRKPQTSDFSSTEEESEVAKNTQKMSCSQRTDSGISCSSQEMLVEDLTLSFYYANTLERLYNREPIRDLMNCGVDVVDGPGDEKVEDKITGKGDDSRLRTGTGKAVGVAADGVVTHTATFEEKRVVDKMGCVKRPAEESSSDLRSSSILDEDMSARASCDLKRPVLGRSESSSSNVTLPLNVGGVKRPAGESCSDLRTSSILDEDMAAGASCAYKRPTLAGSESSSSNVPSLRSDVGGEKRPAEGSCNSSILDEDNAAGASCAYKRPTIAGSESSSSHVPTLQSDVAVTVGQCCKGCRGAEPCCICYSQPKNAAFLHGRSGHFISCYSCAMRIWKTKRLCPMCNLRITKVINIYTD